MAHLLKKVFFYLTESGELTMEIKTVTNKTLLGSCIGLDRLSDPAN